MTKTKTTHRIESAVEADYVGDFIESFLIDRKIRGLTDGSVLFYNQKLGVLTDFLRGRAVERMSDVTADDLRLFLLWLEVRGNNPGGRAAYHRVVRAFMKFWEDETELRSPIGKVPSPRVPEQPLDPVSTEEVTRLIGACPKGAFHGERDRAIFMTLLDSGIRVSELTALDLSDLDLIQSSLFVRRGKGKKPRHVFVGKKTRKQIRRWLRHCGNQEGALFCKGCGERLDYGGLRRILRRRSVEARTEGVTLHDFRRAFCLSLLQAGTPETTIARLMGHANTQWIATYARQTTRDLRESYHWVADTDL